MTTVRIHEAGNYVPGSLEHQIRSNGMLPTLVSQPGQPNVYEIQANDTQVALLKARYFSHRLEFPETGALPVTDGATAKIAALEGQLAAIKARPEFPPVESVAEALLAMEADPHPVSWAEAPEEMKVDVIRAVEQVYEAIRRVRGE